MKSYLQKRSTDYVAYIPHTDADITAMLSSLKLNSIDDLFSEIPDSLLLKNNLNIPAGLTEQACLREMQTHAAKDADWQYFMGAGAYDHYIPAIVWELASRGEFMTAYTPYQAEASQGLLQVIFEYQTMMSRLTAMEMSNASLYDGATALAEAILMAMRCQKRIKQHRILIPAALHPHYRQVVDTLLAPHNCELITLPYDTKTGTLDSNVLAEYEGDPTTALVISHPNFFGALEAMDDLTNWAHAQNMLVIATVNPTSLAILKPPGQWGETGADIVCGEGQPFGIPLSSGGPYFGFFCTRKSLARQMPGRIVGQTQDADGAIAYSLILQTREQHIRRDKATSNICTNQGLAVTAATIYLAVMGEHGLRQVAMTSHHNTQTLRQQLLAIDGVSTVFEQSFFHEVAIRIPNAKQLIETLEQENLMPGLLLSDYYPELEDCLLICATETKTAADIERLVQHVAIHVRGQ